MIQPDFIQIPTQLLTDANLSPLDRIVFGYVYWLQKLKDGVCTASNATLSSLCGSSSTSIQRSLERLETQGYVLRIYEDASKQTRLRIDCRVSYRRTHLQTEGGIPPFGGGGIPPNGGQNKSSPLRKSIEVYSPMPAKQAYTDDDVQLTDLLQELVVANYPFLKPKKPASKAYEAINRLHRLDGYDYRTIEAIIRWSQQDEFWRQNIRSAEKLRKQFEQLLIRAKANIEKNKPKMRTA